ncbi:MAG TPA: PfkB family carbohydrate kinase [Bacteroidales bacterium]|nr:PfkB family carbohydrate kinase [Bacteroidales bacterium]HPJ58146.1 PfkB family carbohydrate kinase [Bacteroidales bacterium]HPR11477.1 PfkB family carbohydrate kinase [Bacteroidales bacterium]
MVRSLNQEELSKILKAINQVKIAIVGDFCLDAYWFVDESMSEISVETGLETRPVSRQSYSPGGAGNVANNLAAIGVGEVLAFGVIGTDPFGTEMIRVMKEQGINTENILVQKSEWDTHTYSKPYISGSELNRIDFGNFNILTVTTADQLIENLIKTIPDTDVIIINQQVQSGIHTEYFRNRIKKVIEMFPDKTFITDSRTYNDFFSGSIRKMNDTEALRLCGKKKDPDDLISLSELEPAANELFNRYRKPLFITRGAMGSVICEADGITQIPGLMIHGKVDTVGAGDTYLAASAATLAAGYGMEEAARLGTLAAGVTVKKLFQTGTASPEEILAIGEDPDFIYSPDLAKDIRKAKYYGDSEIEIISKNKEKPEISHAIFDHDGTISTLREGWEQIMAPVMTKAILGVNFNDADNSLLLSVENRVKEYIDATTGIQTLAQMHGLISLIKEFGCVPDEKILTPGDYKKIYNDELLKVVRVREQKFLKGELCIEDVTVKNSVEMLRILFESGIKLYLASGTDVDEVKREAQVLGYDEFFEGRIYGAVGDITKEAKRIVIDNILYTIGASASSHLVTFGDGPVEIRETVKKGGMAVGVASNELRRYGLNGKKRERLIMAGAAMIIPDFSQYKHVLELLNIQNH